MRKLLLALVTLALCLVAFGASAVGGDPLVLAVASDLHIQKPTPESGAINPLVPLCGEITDALLWTAQRDGAQVLLLCGDITNGGSEAQHEMLLEKLRTARVQGLTILVLPGNHDIGRTTTERFAQLYSDFGYNAAVSRDEDSISYSVDLGDWLLIVLDTDGYGSNGYKPRLQADTLVWLEEQLQAAHAAGKPVLAAGHYPLLSGQTEDFSGREEAIRLLENYGVPLYLCGHLHGRGVATDGRLTELVVDQGIAYPCSYARVTLMPSGDCRYEPGRIDVSAWAAGCGMQDPLLLGFDTYQEQMARQRHGEIVDLLAQRRPMPPSDLAAAREFLVQLFDYSAMGTLYQHTVELLAHPGYPLFMQLAEGANYDRWVPVLLQNTVPYTAGFVLTKDGLEPLELSD